MPKQWRFQHGCRYGRRPAPVVEASKEARVNQPVIFIDDGGVMNDNRLRVEQWQRMVGEFFAPILGGSTTAWAEANRVVMDGIQEPTAWQARLQTAPNYQTFDRGYLLDWLQRMCAIVGVTPPPDAESVELARRASASIVRRVHSAFPGAVEAIRTLHARGFTLHTASGESSRELAGYLEAMGVRDCFGRLFGPDLIDTHKAGPGFYTCLLADAGVAPEAALVVDDNPMVLRWATQVGAKTVLVGAAATDGFEPTLRIGSLAELPEQIRSGWRKMSGNTL